LPEAFSHPAKFSPGLIQKIYAHGIEQGYFKSGDVIGDPFGGIGGGGIFAAYAGLQWVGVELEKKFVDLAKENFELHRPAWEAHGYPVPVILQGDSREFSRIIEGCDSILTSPPFVDCLHGAEGKISLAAQGVGADGEKRGGKINKSYGQTPGQIGRLKAGNLKVSSIVTSPPFMDCHNIVPVEAHSRQVTSERVKSKIEYGKTVGQIGNDKNETYWQAMTQVYQECHRALKPGGYIIVVVKAYVKNKKRVHLPMQTLKLLISLGFTPVERIKAMLVTKSVNHGLFGEDIITEKARKSFFRRLAESKGSPKIDWEEILVVRK